MGITTATPIFGLAFAADGTLWATAGSTAGTLVQINPTTAATTTVATLIFPVQALTLTAAGSSMPSCDSMGGVTVAFDATSEASCGTTWTVGSLGLSLSIRPGSMSSCFVSPTDSGLYLLTARLALDLSTLGCSVSQMTVSGNYFPSSALASLYDGTTLIASSPGSGGSSMMVSGASAATTAYVDVDMSTVGEIELR